MVQKKGQENSSKGDEWAGLPWTEREVTTAQVTLVSFFFLSFFLSFLPIGSQNDLMLGATCMSNLLCFLHYSLLTEVYSVSRSQLMAY